MLPEPEDEPPEDPSSELVPPVLLLAPDAGSEPLWLYAPAPLIPGTVLSLLDGVDDDAADVLVPDAEAELVPSGSYVGLLPVAWNEARIVLSFVMATVSFVPAVVVYA